MMKQRCCCGSILAATLLLGLLLLGLLGGGAAWQFRRELARAAAEFLVVNNDDLPPAGVIHALGGEPGRVDYAVQLYQQGYGPRLFFTGYSAASRQRAIAQGAPPEAIIPHDSTAASTYDEAVELRQFLERSPQPVRAVIVVTNPYHSRRAQYIFSRVLAGRAAVRVAAIPFELGQVQPPRAWWRDPYTRRFVEDEYLKLGYYILRYELGWQGRGKALTDALLERLGGRFEL